MDFELSGFPHSAWRWVIYIACACSSSLYQGLARVDVIYLWLVYSQPAFTCSGNIHKIYRTPLLKTKYCRLEVP